MASQADEGLHHLENELPTHKNERRPGGRAAPVPVYSGWAPLPCAVWMEVAETFAKPWSRPVACADLTTYQSVAIQPVDPVRFPSIGDLTERWGWSAHEVRRLLTDEAAWSDPTLTGNGDRAARWAAIKDARTSRSGSHGSRTDRARIEHGSHKDATVEPAESTTKAHGFNEDRARIALTSLNTRVGSQSTEHRAQTQEKHAPAPAVAELFASLASQTSADTGKATGDATPPTGAAAPLPTDPPPLSADVLAVVAVLAKLNPRSAERMTRGTNDGMVKATRKAIKAMGLPALLARLEYAATVRDDEAMKFWRTTLGGKLAPLLTVDGPWVRGLDEAAADAAELERAPEPVTTPNAPPAEVSEAATAWASMTFRAEWRLLDRGGVPKRPEDAYRDDTPGVVFADEPDEHIRRWHAYRAAGGTRRWREVRSEADRMAFRDAFKAAYESGVVGE